MKPFNEQLHVGDGVSVGEEALAHAFAPGGAKTQALRRVREQFLDRGGEGNGTAPVDEQAVAAVLDLVLAAANPRGDHWTSLPIPLCDTQPKALLKAVLDDDGRLT